MYQHLISHKLDNLDIIIQYLKSWALISTCHHIIGVFFFNGHMSIGQWTFHGVPRVIIFMA